MKHATLFPTTLILLGLTGCGGDATTSAPPSPNAPVHSTLSAEAKPGTAQPAADVEIPPNAKYTIVCTEYVGPGHVQQARLAKENLIRATGRAGFYVVHGDQQSTLYFGYYAQIERSFDPIEAARADKDLQFLRSLVDSSGNKLFPGCLKEALPIADPDGPPQYDLTKIDAGKSPDDPTRKFWTIAIAAYTVDAQGSGTDVGKNRKQLAVESVIAARKMGYEAYYYNGPNVSTVCIGAWPRSAVKEQETNDAQSSADTGQDLVVSAAPLPPGMTKRLEDSGRDIKVFQPRIDIQDPTLTAMMAKFPYYCVNGAEQINRINDPHTRTSVDRPQPTFLVQIPELQPSALNGDTAPAAVDTGSAPVVNPMTPDSGAGQLRSVGQ